MKQDEFDIGKEQRRMVKRIVLVCASAVIGFVMFLLVFSWLDIGTRMEQAAEEAVSDREARKYLERGPEPPSFPPYIVIENDRIFFNGQELVLGTPLTEWQKVLGPGRYAETNRWHVWDEYGINTKVRWVPKGEPNHYILDGLGIWFSPVRNVGPRKMFAGTLRVDGFRIHPDMLMVPEEKPCHFQIGRPLHYSYTCETEKYFYAIGVEDPVIRRPIQSFIVARVDD